MSSEIGFDFQIIVKPESEVPKSKVPKSRPKGLGMTLKSHEYKDKDNIPVLGLDIVERHV